MLPPLNANKTLPPLTASGPNTILPPLSASSAASSETQTAPSASVPALTLPTLLPPLRVALPPVDRSLPHWMDCLFWLSAKNGGGYIRVEDVDSLFRSGAELVPLQQRRTSSRMKAASSLAKVALPALLPVVGTTQTAPSVLPNFLPTVGTASLPPLIVPGGSASSAVATTSTAVVLPPLRKAD